MIKIAIVDDHKLFRTGLRAIFEDIQDFELLFEAGDGKELIDLIPANMPDVVLMDLEMPVMDGVEATEMLQKTYPDVKVLMLTMHDDEKFMLHLMDSGARGYLLKNSEPTELIEAIRTIYETGFYFNSRLSLAMLKNLGKKKGKPQRLHNKVELTDREIEVLKLICQELTTSEIAEKLFLSPRTIETYRKTLFEKTAVKNMAGLVIWAVRQGIVA